MFASLKNPNAWLLFIAMLVAFRWFEKSVPAVRRFTNPNVA